MGVRRAGAVIQIAGDAVFVVMVFVTVLMGMFALMDMGMAVLAAIRMVMGVRMGTERRLLAAVDVRMIVIVAMGVAMHRAVIMDMGVLMRFYVRSTLDLHFTRATTTNCTHTICSYSISISLTRISLPPVGCT
jgi:hypothetical protein